MVIRLFCFSFPSTNQAVHSSPNETEVSFWQFITFRCGLGSEAVSPSCYEFDKEANARLTSSPPLSYLWCDPTVAI